MDLIIAQLLNGLVYGVLLFLMAAGLSLIFGLMNVVSLAHGSFFMLGAFFGLAIFQATAQFLGRAWCWRLWRSPSSASSWSFCSCGRSTGAATWTRCC